MEDDFVLVGDGEDALAEGPVDGAGQGEAVAGVVGASDAFGDDVGGVGFDGGGVDEFLAGDGAGSVVVVEDDVAEGLVALLGAHAVEDAVFLEAGLPLLQRLEAEGGFDQAVLEGAVQIVGEAVGGDAADAEELALGVEMFDEAEAEEAVAGAGGGGFVGDLLDDEEWFGVGQATD